MGTFFISKKSAQKSCSQSPKGLTLNTIDFILRPLRSRSLRSLGPRGTFSFYLIMEINVSFYISLINILSCHLAPILNTWHQKGIRKVYKRLKSE